MKCNLYLEPATRVADVRLQDLVRLPGGKPISKGNARPGGGASDPNGNNGQVSYTFDNVGNRVQRASTVPGVVATGLLNYDANDRTSTDSYDNDGSLLSSGAGANVYDFENHLRRQRQPREGDRRHSHHFVSCRRPEPDRLRPGAG